MSEIKCKLKFIYKEIGPSFDRNLNRSYPWPVPMYYPTTFLYNMVYIGLL